MAPSSSPRTAARWGALALAPLLLAPMSLPAEGEDAFVPTRSPGGWAKLVDTSTDYVDQLAQPGLAQMADGTLLAAWRQTAPSSGETSLVTASIGPDNSIGMPTRRVTWSTLNGDPEVVARPTGAEVVFVGNDGGTGYFGQTNAYRLVVTSAGAVSGPAQERYFAEPAGNGVAFDATRTAQGETIVNQARRWHVGLAGASEDEDPLYPHAPWSMFGQSMATAGNTTYLAHYAGAEGLVERGIYVGPLTPAGAAPQKLPGSWYYDQPIALEGSTTGVLWAAYCTGQEACEQLVLRDVLGGRSLMVPTGEYAARVALAPGPAGRMWVAWQSGSAAVSAVRTNKAVTAFGPVRRSAPFYHLNSIHSVAVDGRSGPADVLVNGREAVWHRRYLVPLTVTASPLKWRVNRQQTVAFTAKDAGDPVPGATVAVAGKTCTTGETGRCSITVPARSKPATLTATVSKPTYQAASVQLKVVS